MMEEFSRTGGGQELFSDIYDVIKEKYSPSLITDSSYRNNMNFREVFRTSYRYHENMSPLSIFINVRRLRREIGEIMKNRQYDIVFNNHPNIFIYRGDVNYLHSFSFLDPVIDAQGNITNILIYRMIKMSGLYDIYEGANFITHGRYTLELSRKMFPYIGISPGKMDYINIPVRDFYDIPIGDKKNRVLVFGRINRDKKLESVLEAAGRMRETKFVIAGAVNRGDETYFQTLKNKAPGNVAFFANPDHQEKVKLFKDSKVYLHTRRKEPYGITVAEAIAFGCVPVVPKSGGPWVDIVEEGKYGLGYDTIPDDEIRIAMAADNEFLKTIIQSRERFSFSLFRERVLDYFGGIASEKRI